MTTSRPVSAGWPWAGLSRVPEPFQASPLVTDGFDPSMVGLSLTQQLPKVNCCFC